jgi:hypothetical protein
LARGLQGAQGYKALWVDPESGEPVRYNACEPVRYVINPAHAPAGAVPEVHEAFEMTSEATGITFTYQGETDEPPVLLREPYQPDRYGDRWAPVLIAWGPVIQSSQVSGEGQTIGHARSDYRLNDSGDPVYVSGFATFAPDANLAPGFGGETRGQLFLHELGHVVGLDHIEDPTSVMNPMVGLRPAMWGGGDRAGLWSLGMGRACVDTPAVP